MLLCQLPQEEFIIELILVAQQILCCVAYAGRVGLDVLIVFPLFSTPLLALPSSWCAGHSFVSEVGRAS